MSGVTNYAAFYKLQNTSSLISNMTSGLQSFGKSGGASSLSSMVIPDYASMNNQRLSAAMTNQSNKAGNSYLDYKEYQRSSDAFSKKLDSVTSNLKSSAAKLQQYGSTSVFNPTGYGSSDGTVASVTSDNSANSTKKDPINLKVSQIATAQSNKTASMSSSGKDLGGSSSITLTNNKTGKTEKLDFKIAYSTTNKDALKEISNKINDSQMGVTASVVEKDGKSSLQITSDKTGTDSAFTAKVTGSAASELKLTASTDAQNAIYSVDDIEKTSQSNDIKVGVNGSSSVSVTLKGEGTADLSPATKDTSSIVDTVKQFANDYNDALELFNSNRDASQAMANTAFSFSASKYNSKSLSEIGINVDNSGKLSVDSKKLATAIEKTPDKVKDVLSGKDGIASTAQKLASDAKINEKRLYPPTSAINDFTATYNRNMNFITTYLSGNMLNSFI